MWKHVLVTAGIVVAIIAVLLGLGCRLTTKPPEYTMEASESIARAFVEEDATYQFDGIDGSLELVHAETLAYPACWEFTYRFESRHAGYGDRTGQMLLQVITPHEARITVQEYKVTKATMDERWNMLTQSFVTQ
jgi:hypothetical protein